MSSERWQKANRIFEQAVELSIEERPAFLDERCAGDEDLRAAVERWLLADADASGFLSEPLIKPPRSSAGVSSSADGSSSGAITATVSSDSGEWAGASKDAASTDLPERFGPYRLLEKIGEGGMGVVYLALRDDDAFRRHVAVKLIAHEAVSEETRRRLSLERQILASLDHPWIARIYDGGTTPEGLPYLVMEHVEGEPIDRHCDLQELSLEQRLDLFRKVCAAVHASHQNLVVHCDLKPSNILVTAEGEPKLLDFGIAKLLSREGAASDATETRWPRPLTPQYASPEQVRGEAISTLSDVYSLGVLLYKLLTGRRLHDLGNRSLRQTELHLEQEPTLPSVVAAESGQGEEVARRLRGDLDAVVLKALRTSPGDRYGSAEQLAADLERTLQGFPVEARRGNVRYRAAKFLRRNRWSVAAAAAAFVSLVVFAVSMALMAGRLTREQAKLSSEKARLQDVVSFVMRVFKSAGPLGENKGLTLRDAVDRNTDLIESSLEDQPRVKAGVLAVLGDIYLELGEPEVALSWARKAREIHSERYGTDSLEYASSLNTVGAALREVERLDDSEQLIREALEWFRSHPEAEPSSLVYCLNNLVKVYCYREDFAGAEADSAEALELAHRLLDDDSIESAAAMVNRAVVLRNTGKVAQAETLYKQGLELYRRIQGPGHPYEATLRYNLALIQRDRGDVEKATASLEAADAQYLEAFGEASSHRVRPNLALGKMVADQGDAERALPYYREAVRVAIASGANPGYVRRSALDFSSFLLKHGQCRGGEDLLRASLDHIRQRAAENWRHYEVEGRLGECLLRQRRLKEAREPLERSYEQLRRLRGDDPALIDRALDRLTHLYRATGETALLAEALASR